MIGRGFSTWRTLSRGVLSFSAVLAITGSAVAADAPTGQVTFSKDVAPIFQAKCQTCHQPNSIAPMSLISYQESRPWARSINRLRSSAASSDPAAPSCRPPTPQWWSSLRAA